MKFLDTYESWDKVFKLVRYEDFFILWIHGQSDSYKIQLQSNELEEFGKFLLSFKDSDLDNTTNA